MAKQKRRRRRNIKYGRLLLVLLVPVLILYCLFAAISWTIGLFHKPAELSSQEKEQQSMVESGYAQACSAEDLDRLTRFGIDVSQFQGSIDWQSVKEAGVEYAFIRVGARGYVSGEIYEDETFLDNLNGAKAVGIPVGVYFFSQAITTEEVIEEADYVLSVLAGTPLELPVVYDFELPADPEARGHNLSNEELAAQAKSFMEHIEQNGYRPMLYLNSNLYSIYQNAGLTERWPTWYAEYGVESPDYCDLDIWQYSDTGIIPGIDDHHVDLNLMRTDFESDWMNKV